MNIISGKFDNQITLFVPNTSKSTSTGAAMISYTEDATIFCYVNTRANYEQFANNKRDIKDGLTIDVRYNDAIDITNQFQFDYEAKRYGIISIFEAPEYGRKNAIRIVGEIIK